MRTIRWLVLSALAAWVASVTVSSCDRDCQFHTDCSDGIFCNGVELCEGGQCSDSREDACTGTLVCNEDEDRCEPDCEGGADVDGDGELSIVCGGADCDDEDDRRSTMRSEVCDPDDLDEDCNPTTYGPRDSDRDGYDDANCRNFASDETFSSGLDCHDTDPGVHPGLLEACNGRDDDCDGSIDEGVLVPSYPDEDGDGYGQQEDAQMLCAGSAGFAIIQGDCDDDLSQVHPGAFRCAADTGDNAAIELCTDEATWSDGRCPGDGPCVEQPDGTGVCLTGGVPECADAIDNDTDGDADVYDEDCSSPLDDSEAPSVCSNGADDDEDSFADFPNDPGCGSREDTIEDDPATPPACANGLDDDNDGATDFVGGEGDQGCISAADTSERQADGASCDNGADDDGDTSIDFPADKTCASHTSAEVPACSNGLDDDFDGTIDDPEDLGCASAQDDSERDIAASNYSCDDGEDDDMDGVADYPADPGCTGPTDTTE